MLTTSQLPAGTKLKTTREVGLWDESKYANRTHFEWPGETPPEGLPPLTQPEELIGGKYLTIGTIVTVETILYHSSAYQCVRASADLTDASGAQQTQTGFLYTTHNSIDQVELYVPPQPEPGPEPQPEPQPQPEPGPEPEPQPQPEPQPEPPAPPGGQPGDVQIEVHAGQTVVVEVKSSITATTSTGSLEVNLVDSNGNAVTCSPVYATGPGGTFEVVIDQSGHGRVDNLPAGIYRISLQRSEPGDTGPQPQSSKLPWVVYFAPSNARIDSSGASTIDEVAQHLVSPESENITKVECRGFAGALSSQVYNDNLRLERAVAVKNELTSKLAQLNRANLEKTTGMGQDDTGTTPELSNRVELWVTAVSSWGQGAASQVSCPRYVTPYFFRIRGTESLRPDSVRAKSFYQATVVLSSAVTEFQAWVDNIARANLRLLECLRTQSIYDTFFNRCWVCRNIDLCRYYRVQARASRSLAELNRQVRDANVTLRNTQIAALSWCPRR